MRRNRLAYAITAACAAAVFISGCRLNCDRGGQAPPEAAQPGRAPRETVESFIRYKETSAASNEAGEKRRQFPDQLLTKRAAAGLKKIAQLEHEQITAETIDGLKAEIIAKKQFYEFDPNTGIIASSGEYSEFLYKLTKEDGAWKIDNISTRYRGGGEYGGFVPKWRAYRFNK